MITDYQLNKLLDFCFRNVTVVNPANLYMTLSTTTISKDGSGCTEPSSSTGFGRISVPITTASFQASSGGLTSNLITIKFNEATADQGTITDVAFFDALTGGNMLYYWKLTTPKVIQSGDTFFYSPNTCKIKGYYPS